jgi:rhodanese-related sulfurtransferase
MTNGKKSIKFEDFKAEVNRILNVPENQTVTQEFKAGICSTFEHFAMATKNYNGFGHTYWMEKGYKEWHDAGEPEFPEKQKYFGLEYTRTYY